jgi:hypothetical protein
VELPRTNSARSCIAAELFFDPRIFSSIAMPRSGSVPTRLVIAIIFSSSSATSRGSTGWPLELRISTSIASASSSHSLFGWRPRRSCSVASASADRPDLNCACASQYIARSARGPFAFTICRKPAIAAIHRCSSSAFDAFRYVSSSFSASGSGVATIGRAAIATRARIAASLFMNGFLSCRSVDERVAAASR